MSRFLMHLVRAFAEMERGIIRERVRLGSPGASSGVTKRWLGWCPIRRP
jgi:DNA invertase Pin-like site-specific DNA recombinase